MNSRSSKNSTVARGIIPRDCSCRFRRGLLRGFTLIEVLAAVVIIVTIVSMVYGSFFAISESARSYQARITLFRHGRKVLGQMARQIRCSYVGPIEEITNKDKQMSTKKNGISENIIDYFSGDADDPSREILHLVTTNGTLSFHDETNGLFDIAYKLDKSTGTLFLSQTRFSRRSNNNIEEKNFRPLFEGIKHIELEFFDGQEWLDKWDFKQKRQLPLAVKIGITCEDRNNQQSHYATIAYVNCHKNQSRKTVPEK